MDDDDDSSEGDCGEFVSYKRSCVYDDGSSDDDSIVNKTKRPKIENECLHALNSGEISELSSSLMSRRSNWKSSNPVNVGDLATITNPHTRSSGLKSMPTNQITDTSTHWQYKKQFDELRKNSPTVVGVWLASIRSEEAAGVLSNARALALEACKTIPKGVDLWLEAIRLHPPDHGKPLVVKALRRNPRSAKLWLAAVGLEQGNEGKKQIFEKARKMLPSKAVFWMKSAELEPPEQAQTLLRQAVECCPNSIELRLALARLLPREEANQVIKYANEKDPKNRKVWIAAAELQERAGNLDLAGKIIQRSVEDLIRRGVEIVRSEWLQEAMDAERAGLEFTCHNIIKLIIGWNIAEDARLDTWLNDAESFIKRGSINCARAVYMTITEDKSFLQNEKAWLAYANFEYDHGHYDKLIRMLKRSIEPEHCGKSEALWLMLAEQTRDIPDEYRSILERARETCPTSDKIVIAAAKLEIENGDLKAARRTLSHACLSIKSAQLVLRSAKLEWSMGNLDGALRILKMEDGEYKNYPEFYLSLGQMEKQLGDINKAKDWLSKGLRFNPTSVELWISMAYLEEDMGAPAKARSLLEMARFRNPHNVRLWLESALLERRHYGSDRMKGTHRGQPDSVIAMLVKGIEDCIGQPGVEKLEKMQAEIHFDK